MKIIIFIFGQVKGKLMVLIEKLNILLEIPVD